jgi:hypothetical protein
MSQVLDPSPPLAQAREQLQAAARRYAWQHWPLVLPWLALALIAAQLTRLAWKAPVVFPITLSVLAAYAAFRAAQLGARIWRTRLANTVQALDHQYPALENSAWLLLQPSGELSFLSALQQELAANRLGQLAEQQHPLLPLKLARFKAQSLLFILLAAGLYWVPAVQRHSPSAGMKIRFSPAAKPARPGQPLPPRISETRLLVTPPAYTRLPAFAPTQASFQCPENSLVRWQVQVSGTTNSLPVVEIGRQRRALQPVAGQAGKFFVEMRLKASTLYRLRLAGAVSDDYAIDVRPDQAPVLRITSPKPYSLVAAVGQRPEVPIRATVRDDYGLSRAELVITVAQGQGEAVKFRELRRDLSAGLSSVQGNLGSALNLPKLGLTYGDELYFYLTARDNAGHTARTDTYLVQWQDTAVADSAPDLGMGVKVAPAYFRSQRQIIIDTEKLIAEKAKLDAATVASRANALGFDQQTLRLRYGKFLGEESEAGIGAPAPRAPVAEDEDAPAAPTADAPEHDEHGHDEHDHAAPPDSPAKTSPTAETDALMDPYIHKHDDAETADFLEPAVKTKLHAVLDQMWAAELRLRTGQLQAARPYEYRALRLLKEVQQQTRVFVKKAGFTPPPLPEATVRLTGELAGAAVPHRQQQLKAPLAQPAVRAALAWLAERPARSIASPTDARLLDRAGTVLAEAALEQPGIYLPALKALRQLVADVRAGRPACAGCRPTVERALTDLLPAPAPTPVSAAGPDRLGRRYFQELSR